MQKQAADHSLDDVQVLGMWNFTLQGDTPLFWLRTGQLDKYLLKFRVTMPCPATCGMVLHSEVDGPGTDGISFWIERRLGRDGTESSRRYLLAGDGLESKPIVTRSYPDPGVGGPLTEDIEVLMEGWNGTIMLQDRKVSLKFRTKHQKGSVAFYNSTQAESDEVHFGDVRITAMRRGPVELDGRMLRRERALDQFQAGGVLDPGAEAAQRAGSPTKGPTRSSDAGGRTTSKASSIAVGQNAKNLQRTPSQPLLKDRKAQFQLASSECALRKTGGALLAAGKSPMAAVAHGHTQSGSREKWIPLALNAPAGEQKLLQSMAPHRRPLVPSSGCTDFIAM